MLSLLKESVQSKHAERLEQIVIALIGIEIGPLCCCLVFKSIIDPFVHSSWGHHYPGRFVCVIAAQLTLGFGTTSSMDHTYMNIYIRIIYRPLIAGTEYTT